MRNYTNVGLISLFLESAQADFVCVAANSFAELVILLQSAEADFACVAANSFAGNSPKLSTVNCQLSTVNRNLLDMSFSSPYTQ